MKERKKEGKKERKKERKKKRKKERIGGMTGRLIEEKNVFVYK